MLILILIDIQYSQKAVFSFKKSFEWSKPLLSRLPPPDKKKPLQNFGPPLTAIWKIMLYAIFIVIFT